MKSIIRIVAAAACTSLVATTTLPALAQYANDFQLAKVVRQGKTTHPIAGTGIVKVQVQVNANGTHRAIKVLSSTNHGDDAAAMQIAQNSTYRPARRGGKPVASFYDFILKFTGKSVARQAGSSMTGAAAAVNRLILAGKYDDAVSQANVALLSSPGNPQLLQLLATAQYYKKDYADSAAAFARVSTIAKPFIPIAAQAFAQAAVMSTDPAAALTYANKAVAASNDANSQYALGVAQVANKQFAAAIATLKPLPAKTANREAKEHIERELLLAYQGAGDKAGAAATLADLKAIDPSAAASAQAAQYLQLGDAASKAKNYTEALKEYDLASQSADKQTAVTGNVDAAFTIFRMPHPDWTKAKTYAMKAVTAAPLDPIANYAAGIAWSGVYAGSRNGDDKTQALNYLKKADSLAKAAGNTGLSLQIETQIKQIPQ